MYPDQRFDAVVSQFGLMFFGDRPRALQKMCRVLADLRGWLPVMGVNLGEEQIQRSLHEAEHALGSYVTTSGAMVFDLSAHLVSGTTSSGG